MSLCHINTLMKTSAQVERGVQAGTDPKQSHESRWVGRGPSSKGPKNIQWHSGDGRHLVYPQKLPDSNLDKGCQCNTPKQHYHGNRVVSHLLELNWAIFMDRLGVVHFYCWMLCLPTANVFGSVTLHSFQPAIFDPPQHQPY